MGTQQYAAAPARRETLAGDVLDAEIRQQVAELNQRAIGALLELLVATGMGRTAEAGSAGRRTGTSVRGAARAATQRVSQPPVPWAEERLPASIGHGRSFEPEGAPSTARAVVPPAAAGAPAQWLALDTTARAALASAPYLLVTVDVGRLLAPDGSAVAGSSFRGVSATSALASSSPPGPQSAAPWSDVARLVVQYAWHLAQLAPVLAGFVLGLPAAEVEALRALGLSRVDALASSAAFCVRLRWSQDSAFWSEWLAAVRSGEAAALWTCQLRGLQRIAGECRSSPGGGAT
ncbi:MAG: hypothetical protein R3E75_06825 [Steroidobacteraceae bacterium]|nr:hypothetical protein [Nevskiaceae bacterium]MCP5470807.1 hypothetical protein [Nevskiaceae bacterium]